MPTETMPDNAVPGAFATRRARGRYLAVKAGVEWAVAGALLVLTAPLLVGLATFVKLNSRGPAFYTQTRLGLRGRPFRICKLRTMTHGCEAATGPVWSIGNDPRITGIGRWLRDTHLDELPQLWNVVRGEMSLIGPRPERPEIAATIERALPEFRRRLAVRPGITGLAQMRLPADSDLHTVQRKLAHDLQYVRSMGLLTDARIAVSTVFHFVGMAAGAASRVLVRSLAPPQAEDGVSIRLAFGVAGVETATLYSRSPAGALSEAA